MALQLFSWVLALIPIQVNTYINRLLSGQLTAFPQWDGVKMLSICNQNNEAAILTTIINREQLHASPKAVAQKQYLDWQMYGENLGYFIAGHFSTLPDENRFHIMIFTIIKVKVTIFYHYYTKQLTMRLIPQVVRCHWISMYFRPESIDISSTSF